MTLRLRILQQVADVNIFFLRWTQWLHFIDELNDLLLDISDICFVKDLQVNLLLNLVENPINVLLVPQVFLLFLFVHVVSLVLLRVLKHRENQSLGVVPLPRNE